MGLSLHNQIAALPLTGPLLDVRPYLGTGGGRLFTDGDGQDPLWLADLPISASTDILPMRSGLRSPPLVHHFFLSADRSYFHQLRTLPDWNRPVDADKVVLSATPGLPPLGLHWKLPPVTSGPASKTFMASLVYAPVERMMVELTLKRVAPGNTLIDGAFYAFSTAEAPRIPDNLNQWSQQVSRGR